ncbi:hypothetical protein FBALC1_02632 [Flavobacteriales bacterium ALC-1]|nr:hypothetical protein FBALC1_02632 [Flavobacteriales bacterium ALC-1]
MSSSSSAKISSAMVFKNAAFCFPDVVLNVLKASEAKATAASISSDVASL